MFQLFANKSPCEKRRQDFLMLEMSQIDKIFIKGQLCRMETKVCPLGFFCLTFVICHII